MHGAPAPTSVNSVLYSGFSHRGFAAAAGWNGRSGNSTPRYRVCLAKLKSKSYYVTEVSLMQTCTYMVGKKDCDYLKDPTNKMLSNDANELRHQRIFFSDVEVTRKRNLLWGRKWRSLDMKVANGILFLHFLALFAPYMFSWDARNREPDTSFMKTQDSYVNILDEFRR
ncbi:putative acyl-CoA desaturase [Helianthus anomalus]